MPSDALLPLAIQTIIIFAGLIAAFVSVFLFIKKHFTDPLNALEKENLLLKTLTNALEKEGAALKVSSEALSCALQERAYTDKSLQDSLKSLERTLHAQNETLKEFQDTNKTEHREFTKRLEIIDLTISRLREDLDKLWEDFKSITKGVG